MNEYPCGHRRQTCKWRMGLALAVTLLVGLITAPALAQAPVTPEEAMAVANRDYEAGDFANAAATYELIIAAGIHNSAVYYNLGNAYFKQGDLGRAILNYRRAQLLTPRDPDIAANLALARRQTVDRLEASPQGALTNLMEIAEERLTLQEAALLALALWALICGLAALAILQPQRRRVWFPAMAVLSFFLVAGLISNTNRYYINQRYPPAVIVAPQVDVTSGPGADDRYLVEFELHSGAEVRLVESRPGWRRIIISEELQGWVPEDAVERVDAPYRSSPDAKPSG